MIIKKYYSIQDPEYPSLEWFETKDEAEEDQDTRREWGEPCFDYVEVSDNEEENVTVYGTLVDQMDGSATVSFYLTEEQIEEEHNQMLEEGETIWESPLIEKVRVLKNGPQHKEAIENV